MILCVVVLQLVMILLFPAPHFIFYQLEITCRELKEKTVQM